MMATVMGLGLISCVPESSGSDDNTSYIPEETVTLTVYSNLSSELGYQKGWFADVMLEKFNVKLKLVQPQFMEDDYLNSDNYYDGPYDIVISWGYHGEDFQEAMKNGCFLDMNKCDMETYMPYVREHLEHAYVNSEEDAESVYAFCGSTSNPGDHDQCFYTWDLRYDYYEELGKPEIKDIEDWVKVLEQMKELHPTTEEGEEVYGITCPNFEEDHIVGISLFVTGYYGYESAGMGYYDWKNDRYHGTLEIEEDGTYGPYLEMLKLHNELYRKGLLDPDIETQSWDDMLKKIEKGQILSSIAGYIGSSVNESMYPVIPKAAHLVNYEIGQRKRCIAIGKQTEYPELCMAIVDYFYSPEGMLTMYYGPKGECWYYEDGYACLTETGKKGVVNPGEGRLSDAYSNQSLWDGYPVLVFIAYDIMATNTDNNEPYNHVYWKSTVEAATTEAEKLWREDTGYNSVEKYMYEVDAYYNIPGIKYPDFTETELCQKYDETTNIIVSKSWEAIKASSDEEFDAIVKDMIASATAAGYEECVQYSEDFVREQRAQVE